MPKISLYIDKDTLGKIEKAAAKEKISISKWVGNNIKKVIKEDYPEGYFDLFGSITDKSFKIKELSFKEVKNLKMKTGLRNKSIASTE